MVQDVSGRKQSATGATWHDAELHDWSLAQVDHGVWVVNGRIFNDSKGRFSDGDRVHTSTIRFLANGRLETRNTKYLLVNAEQASA